MRTSSPPTYTFTKGASSPSLQELVAERRVALDEVVEHLADGLAFGSELARAADLGAERRRDAHGRHQRAAHRRVAELDVVDVLGDRRVVAADRAVGVAAHRDLVERRPERVEEEQSPGERVAAAEDELERLVRLERADDPGQHAEDAALRAARRELGRRRLREEAAVARAARRGVEHRDLALEAEDRAVHDRDAAPHGGVVHEVARREVVGAVDDDVPAVAEDAVDVLRGEPLLERDDAARPG